MEKSIRLEEQGRKAALSAFVDESLRKTLREQPREIANDHTFIYHRGFPIGSALADIFAHRCSEQEEEGPTGLYYLIREIIGMQHFDAASSPEAAARYALLSGFCWELGDLLRLGANGGFRFKHHDESAMLVRGISRSRDGDHVLTAQLLQPDDEDEEVSHA